MQTGRIVSLLIAVVVVAIVAYFLFARSQGGPEPGQPAPHAIDLSQ